MNNNKDILFRETKLEELINRLETKAKQIKDRFETIKTEMTITDGSDVWRSKSQEVFKRKKDQYINQFEVVSEELQTQIALLRKAQEDLRTAENDIKNNINPSISDLG